MRTSRRQHFQYCAWTQVLPKLRREGGRPWILSWFEVFSCVCDTGWHAEIDYVTILRLPDGEERLLELV
jgi:hypothetical protein